MASDRDTLTAILLAAGEAASSRNHSVAFFWEPLAAAVIAAGWRAPARLITNAELEALPSGAVVLRDGRAWQREHDVWWLGGVASAATGPFGAGAITVLYDPTEEPADEQ